MERSSRGQTHGANEKGSGRERKTEGQEQVKARQALEVVV